MTLVRKITITRFGLVSFAITAVFLCLNSHAYFDLKKGSYVTYNHNSDFYGSYSEYGQFGFLRQFPIFLYKCNQAIYFNRGARPLHQSPLKTDKQGNPNFEWTIRKQYFFRRCEDFGAKIKNRDLQAHDIGFDAHFLGRYLKIVSPWQVKTGRKKLKIYTFNTYQILKRPLTRYQSEFDLSSVRGKTLRDNDNRDVYISNFTSTNYHESIWPVYTPYTPSPSFPGPIFLAHPNGRIIRLLNSQKCHYTHYPFSLADQKYPEKCKLTHRPDYPIQSKIFAHHHGVFLAVLTIKNKTWYQKKFQLRLYDLKIINYLASRPLKFRQVTETIPNSSQRRNHAPKSMDCPNKWTRKSQSDLQAIKLPIFPHLIYRKKLTFREKLILQLMKLKNNQKKLSTPEQVTVLRKLKTIPVSEIAPSVVAEVEMPINLNSWRLNTSILGKLFININYQHHYGNQFLQYELQKVKDRNNIAKLRLVKQPHRPFRVTFKNKNSETHISQSYWSNKLIKLASKHWGSRRRNRGTLVLKERPLNCQHVEAVGKVRSKCDFYRYFNTTTFPVTTKAKINDLIFFKKVGRVQVENAEKLNKKKISSQNRKRKITPGKLVAVMPGPYAMSTKNLDKTSVTWEETRRSWYDVKRIPDKNKTVMQIKTIHKSSAGRSAVYSRILGGGIYGLITPLASLKGYFKGHTKKESGTENKTAHTSELDLRLIAALEGNVLCNEMRQVKCRNMGIKIDDLMSKLNRLGGVTRPCTFKRSECSRLARKRLKILCKRFPVTCKKILRLRADKSICDDRVRKCQQFRFRVVPKGSIALKSKVYRYFKYSFYGLNDKKFNSAPSVLEYKQDGHETDTLHYYILGPWNCDQKRPNPIPGLISTYFEKRRRHILNNPKYTRLRFDGQDHISGKFTNLLIGNTYGYKSWSTYSNAYSQDGYMKETQGHFRFKSFFKIGLNGHWKKEASFQHQSGDILKTSVHLSPRSDLHIGNNPSKRGGIQYKFRKYVLGPHKDLGSEFINTLKCPLVYDLSHRVYEYLASLRDRNKILKALTIEKDLVQSIITNHRYNQSDVLPYIQGGKPLLVAHSVDQSSCREWITAEKSIKITYKGKIKTKKLSYPKLENCKDLGHPKVVHINAMKKRLKKLEKEWAKQQIEIEEQFHSLKAIQLK